MDQPEGLGGSTGRGRRLCDGIGRRAGDAVGTIAGIFLLGPFPVTALWTCVGVGVARFLHEERGVRIFNVTMAVLLVVSLFGVL